MAIYSTFFISKPHELSDGFPGWRLPLPESVKREIINPFTKEMVVIETRAPEWPEGEIASTFPDPYRVIRIEGNYVDYLGGRWSPFVRERPHWCAKGLTGIELGALGRIWSPEPLLEFALYSRLSVGATLQQFRTEFILNLALLDGSETEAVAGRWAALMSTPEYTHSVAGQKIKDGWRVEDAMGILGPLVALAKQCSTEERAYLLIEP